MTFDARALHRQLMAQECKNKGKDKLQHTPVKPEHQAQTNGDFEITFLGMPLVVQRRISSGTYGAVYQVKGKDGLLFAAKILHNVKGVDPDIQHDMDNLKDISREISLQHRFSSSPCIVRALGVACVTFQNQMSSLLMELCQATLHHALTQEDSEEVSVAQKNCGQCNLVLA